MALAVAGAAAESSEARAFSDVDAPRGAAALEARCAAAVAEEDHHAPHLEEYHVTQRRPEARAMRRCKRPRWSTCRSTWASA